MKKIIIAGLLSIVFCDCLSKTNPDSSKRGNTIINNSTDYPKEVVHLGLQSLYDKSKWILYCINSDEEVKFRPFSKDKVTFGELPLRFSGIQIKEDTIHLDFAFYYKDAKLTHKNISNEVSFGTVFKGRSGELVYVHTGGDMPYYYVTCPNLNNCPYRFARPLQPEVIKYIKGNKSKLDPWFRKEAIKRGVINE